VLLVQLSAIAGLRREVLGGHVGEERPDQVPDLEVDDQPPTVTLSESMFWS
jgi:hypothetical protein